MIETRSAIWSTSAIWCEEKKTVISSAATWLTSARRTSSVIAGSRPEVGPVQVKQLRPTAGGRKQRQLGANAARQLLHAALLRQLEALQVPLLEIGPPLREEGCGEADHLGDAHVAVEVLLVAHEARAA